MRPVTLLFLTLFQLSGGLSAQQTITASIEHDGLEREYILYVPGAYDGMTAVPLVLNFHGYTSNAFEQMFYGDFRSIADTANFLVVHPLGTEDANGNTHWNVGWGASTVDDVAFTNALLDSLSATYNVDQERIYSTGMSNGGFMSYQLACELSERIAAIASVTGTMNQGSFATCAPTHPMPVLEIHGTADAVVPYAGANWIEGSEDVVAFWADFNNAAAEPTVTELPDLDTTDGSTVERWVYAAGDDGSSVELFKVIDGGHTWPGSVITFPGTNRDIDASQEIWRFFSQYDINGLNPITSTEAPAADDRMEVFPNPATERITVSAEDLPGRDYRLVTITGRPARSGTLRDVRPVIDLTGLAAGVYILYVGTETRKVIVVNR